MRYLVVIEKGKTTWGAHVPDLPGCIALGKSHGEVVELITEAIDFHIEGLRQHGDPIPAPASLRTLAEQYHSPRACAYHYLHMAQGNFREYLKGQEVWTKKYLYVLRPLLAIQWIERGLGVIPMEFQRLVEHVVPVGGLRSAIDDLVERKRQGSELERGPRIVSISEFIESELGRHEGELLLPSGPALEAEELDSVFHEALDLR
jgi:predicted nucleotidyltransferase